MELSQKEKHFCDLVIQGTSIKEAYKIIIDPKNLDESFLYQSSLLYSKRKAIREYLIENHQQRLDNISFNRDVSIINYDNQIKTLELLKLEVEEIEEVEVKAKMINDIIKTIIKIEELKGKLFSLYVVKTENTEILKLGEGFSKFRARQLRNAKSDRKVIEGQVLDVVSEVAPAPD